MGPSQSRVRNPSIRGAGGRLGSSPPELKSGALSRERACLDAGSRRLSDL